MYCDILIVGGGPAGSSAALSASKASLNVIVVDKRRSIGEPVQCAEYVPRLLLHETDFSRSCIVQEIQTIQLYTPKGLIKEFASSGYMLNRTVFDKELATQAIRCGAKYMINTCCVRKEQENIILQQGLEEAVVTPKVIIGADGPSSTVGSWIHKIHADYVLGIQAELPLCSPKESLEIHFWKEFLGGYGWLFPKGLVANVGIGIKHGAMTVSEARKKLFAFCAYLKEEGKVIDTPLSLRSGLIPCSGLFSESVAKNILLVGDAAGQTHPITGGGIAPAVICGKIAGDVSAMVVKTGRFDKLHDYDTNFRKVIGKELARATKKRIWMEQHWEKLEENVKYFWPSFQEYYD